VIAGRAASGHLVGARCATRNCSLPSEPGLR
jgi:hypothetical protein